MKRCERSCIAKQRHDRKGGIMLTKKQQEKVDKIQETAGFQNAPYAIYEAGLTEGAAHECRETTPFPAETPVTPAPVQDDELIEIADRAYNSENGSSPSFHYCDLRAAIAAVRPQIEAERDKQWEKEIRAELVHWTEPGLTAAIGCMFSRLTPPQEPTLEERLHRIVSAEGVNVENKVAEIMHEITPAPEPAERVKVEPFPSKISGDDFVVVRDGKSILAVNKREWCEGYAARVRTELAAERKEAGNE
jgi:hypothetical protein